MTFFRIFEISWLKHPPHKIGDSRAPLGLRWPRGATTSHPHSSTTTCRRKNGRRCPTSARGERGNRPPGYGSLAPPPLDLRRCLLFFLFRTPTILNVRIAFGHLIHGQSHGRETTSAPASTASTTTPGLITAASNRRRSPCAESATRALFAWPNNGESRPAREHCNQEIGCCSPVRCIVLPTTAALLYCCTG